jgi:hypothetical protein
MMRIVALYGRSRGIASRGILHEITKVDNTAAVANGASLSNVPY